MPSEPLTDAEREVADDQAWQSGYAAGRAAASHSYRTALGLARTPDIEGLQPYSGRIEAFDAVLAFLDEMRDADGLVERSVLRDKVSDLRSRATAARAVALVAAPTPAPPFWTHHPHCNDRCVHYLEGEPDKTASGSRPEPSHGAPSDVSAPGRPPAPDGAPATPAPEADTTTIDEQVDQLEAIVHPEGRCAVCGGGKPYWKHGSDHPFTPAPFTPAPESPIRAIRDAHTPDPDDPSGMGWSKTGDYVRKAKVCRICGTADKYGIDWPCWTYEQAEAALSGERP